MSSLVYRRTAPLFSLAYLLGDLVMLSVASITAAWILFGHDHLARVGLPGGWPLYWFPAAILAFAVVGLYGEERTDNGIEHARLLFNGVSVAIALVVVGAYAAHVPLSRAWIGFTWILSLLCASVGRFGMRKTLHALRRRGHLRRRALIVGADDSADALLRSVQAAPWTGLDIVGLVSVNGHPSTAMGRPVVGSVERLPELTTALAVTEVLVAPSVTGNGHLAGVVEQLRGVPVALRLAPGLKGFLPARLTVQPLGDVSLLSVERVEFRTWAKMAKRLIDIVGATVLLVLAAPVIGVVAVAVKLDSLGPVFFKQRRLGKDGKTFLVWKFRTMDADAEALRPELSGHNGTDGLLFKLEHDPRVTRVGSFLRRTSIDELPQLWNVLRADMSLVGPRPLPLDDCTDPRYRDFLARRVSVRPGITGLWQIGGRSAAGQDALERLDTLYVENWSPLLDLAILVRTVPAVLLGRGAS